MQSIFQAMQQGKNPREFVREMASNDPRWQAVNDAIGMRSPQDVGAQMDKSARGQGTTLQAAMQALVRQIGLPIK